VVPTTAAIPVATTVVIVVAIVATVMSVDAETGAGAFDFTEAEAGAIPFDRTMAGAGAIAFDLTVPTLEAAVIGAEAKVERVDVRAVAGGCPDFSVAAVAADRVAANGVATIATVASVTAVTA
jgi:hypothetical protein